MAERLQVDDPAPLFEFLKQRLPTWNRNTLRERLRSGCVLVNGTTTTRREHGLTAGDRVDVVALGLPRSLSLTAPDGETRSFDLSDPSQPRDLSLTPELIDWIEQHFGFEKLKADYPHWNDARSER